jgi:lipoyl(octanoyl) transferase
MNRSRRVTAFWLGRISYRTAWDLQRSLVEAVRAGEAADCLLLLEHPHVFTMGRRGTADHLLWDEAERAGRDVEVVWSDRGGDATYHGPGQLVGYPIIDLARLGHDILSYLRTLEDSLIAYVATLGIAAERGGPGLTGVWSAGEKVAAIGVKLNQSVVSHGFALNLTTDLSYFDGIVPCGLTDKRPTSVERLGCVRIATHDAARDYAGCFEDTFAVKITWGEAKDLEGLPPATEPVPLLTARTSPIPLL